jgi:hypothetical protein
VKGVNGQEVRRCYAFLAESFEIIDDHLRNAKLLLLTVNNIDDR